jgi:8-oxo-dGTP pyrophosphatase MutT (NUDIX family)
MTAAPTPGWVPLAVGGQPRGRIIPAVATVLHDLPALFESSDGAFVLRDAGEGADARSRLLQEAAVALRAAGLVPGWRDELCELRDESGVELARFERGAFRTLGLQNRAVHVNGLRADGRLWIARRSPKKTSAPGKLDNMAAGAIAAGESPADCAVRELWEEAGVPAGLAGRVALSGRVLRSLRPLRHGVHDELLLCADLVLPDEFVPAGIDGEVAEFLCMDLAEAAIALAAGEFSVEAGLVLADWLARQPAPRG